VIPMLNPPLRRSLNAPNCGPTLTAYKDEVKSFYGRLRAVAALEPGSSNDRTVDQANFCS
jgi:hypothetical protein